MIQKKIEACVNLFKLQESASLEVDEFIKRILFR